MTKNNEKFWRWTKIVIAILLPLLCAVYAYGRLNGRVEAVEANVKKTEDTRERLIRVEEGVDYLKKAVDRIESKIDR